MKVDRPIKSNLEDLFGLQFYAKALVKCVDEFVTAKETPLTIGIQGDWGTGKTSLLNLLKLELEEKYLIVDFNSWMFSKEVDIGSELILRVSDKIMQTLQDGKQQDWSSKLEKGLKYILRGSKSYLESKGVDFEEKRVRNCEITKFYDNLVSCVDKVLSTENKEAVAVFIDDLDRVVPDKAIEITEAIKNFLDVPGCVFFIACDYGVVKKGLKTKFGFDENSREARQYLDKIFQIPFRMPLCSDIHRKKYLEKCFETEVFSEKQLSVIDETICGLKLDNPRTIKRVLGVYRLLQNMQGESVSAQGKLDLLLLVILQQYSPAIHHHIAKVGSPDNYEDFAKEIQEGKERLDNFWELFESNPTLCDWLQKRQYQKYLDLTNIVDSGNVADTKGWSNSTFTNFVANISNENARDTGKRMHSMFYELSKKFPQTKLQYKKVKSSVVYGKGKKPAISLKVTHSKISNRSVVPYLPSEDGGTLIFFYWARPRETFTELWEATIRHFHKRLQKIFAPFELNFDGGIEICLDTLCKQDDLSELRDIIFDMMMVRVRPESAYSEEKLRELGEME